VTEEEKKVVTDLIAACGVLLNYVIVQSRATKLLKPFDVDDLKYAQNAVIAANQLVKGRKYLVGGNNEK